MKSSFSVLIVLAPLFFFVPTSFSQSNRFQLFDTNNGSNILFENMSNHFIGLSDTSIGADFKPAANFHIKAGLGDNPMMLLEPQAFPPVNSKIAFFAKDNMGIRYDFIQMGIDNLGSIFENRVAIKTMTDPNYALKVNGDIQGKNVHLTQGGELKYMSGENHNEPFFLKYNNTNSILIDPLGSKFAGLLQCDNFRLNAKNVNGFFLMSDNDGNAMWTKPTGLTDKYWTTADEGVMVSHQNYKKIGLLTDEVISQIQFTKGASKLCFGTLCDREFEFGNSYIGFNAGRMTIEEPVWIFDAAPIGQNGGSVIWGNMNGNIHFATIPSKGDPTAVRNDKGAGPQKISDRELISLCKMTISHTGFVGIGTTEPIATLDVRGSIVSTSLTTSNGYSVLASDNTGLVSKSPIFISNDGKVAIGTNQTPTANGTSYALYVKGGILAEEVKIKLMANWPDYIFSGGYYLMDIYQLDAYIQKNKHLPGVPTEKEVANDGIDLAQMNGLLLEKVEELTLHIITLQKQLDEVKAKIK